jgi:hypothetical protein
LNAARPVTPSRQSLTSKPSPSRNSERRKPMFGSSSTRRILDLGCTVANKLLLLFFCPRRCGRDVPLDAKEPCPNDVQSDEAKNQEFCRE